MIGFASGHIERHVVARVLIICPTHDHVDTLYFSIASAQVQTFEDWKMVVICDGAPQRTLKILQAISKTDDRITFEAHPKSYKTGEIHRDRVVRGSDAEYVCHLGDDDIWAPDHLENMLALLQKGDWVSQSPLRILNSGGIAWIPRNMGGQFARQSMGKRQHAIAVGFSHTAYRMESYLSLTVGWSQTPKNYRAGDQFMAAKFLTRPDITVASTAACSSLKFTSGSSESRALPPQSIACQIAPWLAKIARPGLMQSAARSSEMGSVLLRLLSVFAPDQDHDIAAAYAACGLKIVGEASPCNVAVNGAPMHLPLTAAQTAQADRAYVTFMAWFHAGISVSEWVSHVGQSDKTWVRWLSGLAQTRPQIAARALYELEARYGDNSLLTRRRISLHIQSQAFDAAQEDLARARRLWPRADWTKAMADELEVALRDVAPT